jgi:positive regulator of sigma E activity
MDFFLISGLMEKSVLNSANDLIYLMAIKFFSKGKIYFKALSRCDPILLGKFLVS